jgi:hypothetical protein
MAGRAAMEWPCAYRALGKWVIAFDSILVFMYSPRFFGTQLGGHGRDFVSLRGVKILDSVQLSRVFTSPTLIKQKELRINKGG